MEKFSITTIGKYRNLIIGSMLSLLFLSAALVSFLWTPFDVTEIDITNKLKTPGQIYWLGTDHFGRDILSMIMVGARTSIAVALVAVGIGIVIGTCLLYTSPSPRDVEESRMPSSA